MGGRKSLFSPLCAFMAIYVVRHLYLFIFLDFLKWGDIVPLSQRIYAP
jgi:hypothetical protein